jgi:ligand-binding sensor domain-containing protein/signal transduction histidine kinase/DNA-binding response OmpR family regulator
MRIDLKTKRYFLLLLLCCITFVSRGQQQIVFRNYSVADGLRSNTVWSITQDDQGYMWFGTKNGLSRFDGYQFKSYQFDKQNKNSLSDNFIHSILKFDDETFWLGTESGVSILNLKKESFEDFEPLKNNVVFDIVKDKKGIVWIATKVNGLYRYDPKTKDLKNFRTSNQKKGVSSNQIRKLAIDKSGNLWIGTFGNGLDKLNTSNFSFKNFKTDNSGLSNNFILTVYADLDGNIWAGTLTGGLDFYNQKNNSFRVYKKGQNSINDDIVRSIYQPTRNKLYVGTEKGLNVLNIATGEFKAFTNQISDPLSISDNAVYSIFHDREGGIWIGTFFGGVNYFQENGSEFELYYPTGDSNSLSGSAVSSFLEDKPGNFWVGTEDGGLNYFNSTDKTFKHYPFEAKQQNISYHNIHTLFKDTEGNIWIGTFTGGLNIYHPKTDKVSQYRNDPNNPKSISNNSIYSIYQDLEGNIWVGTVKGLNLYNKKTDDFTRVKEMGLAVNCIYSIYEDAAHNMWYGTYDSGVIGHNKETGEWLHFSADGKDGSISSNKVISMLDDHQGNLWIGTDGGGLNKLDLRTHKFSVFDSRSGISANVIYGILQDSKKFLWISTNDGIYSFQPSSSNVKHYTNWDYLQSRQFNYSAAYKASDGKLYFGGIRGFNAFYPDSIARSNVQTHVAFTNFQLFNKDVKVNDENSPLTSPISYTETVKVAYSQSVISFEYAALSYVAPRKLLYAYKLDGFDKNWNYVGDQRKATFTNLPPGDYTFQVKASTDEHNWEVPVSSIALTVKPPFYRTNLAYVLYVLFAIAAFVFIRRYLALKVLKRNEIRLERLKVEKEKEFYTQKIEFFTAMAHEIRTPLSLITAPLEKLLEIKKWEPMIQKQLNVMDANANRLLTLVNQLLDFRRIESDIYQIHKEEIDLVALIQSLYSRFSAMEYQKGIKFTLSTKVSNLSVQADSEALTKIFSNLIINAFKFTRTKVKISIQEPFDLEGQHFFKINVEDDGIGIPSSEINNIFTKFFKVSHGGHQYTNLGGTGIGLALAKSLAEKHDGRLEVTSTENVSTVFSVVIPYKETVQELPATTVDESTLETTVEEDDSDKQIVMIVEDDDSLIDFYNHSLHQEGYKVIMANNGLEALEVLNSHYIDLILSDVMMPEMDGLALCKEVKSSIDYSHIPLILLTARANSEAEIAGIENGADAYITKPFKWKHVTAIIKNLMDSHARLKEKFTDQPFINADSLTSNTKDKQFLEKITEIIENRIMDPQLSVEELSREVAMSRSSLHKKLKSLSGHVPNEFIRLVRLKHAAKLLLTNDYNISEIGYMVGFNSHSYFSKCFFNQFKLTPSEFLGHYSKAETL